MHVMGALISVTCCRVLGVSGHVVIRNDPIVTMHVTPMTREVQSLGAILRSAHAATRIVLTGAFRQPNGSFSPSTPRSSANFDIIQNDAVNADLIGITVKPDIAGCSGGRNRIRVGIVARRGL